MSAFHRSGLPEHIVGTTAAATLEKWPITAGPTMHLTFFNTDAAETIELFLTLEAATAGAGNGIEVLKETEITLEVEVKQFWTLSTNAADFRALATCRT